MKQTIGIKLKVDAEGYVTQECGRCSHRFKVNGDNKDKLSFCPWCGRKPIRHPKGTSQGFLTDAQAEYGMSVAAEQLVEPEIKKLEQAFRDLGRGNKFIKVKTGNRQPIKAKAAPKETEGDMQTRTVSPCCGFEVRHEPDAAPVYCGKCGKDGNGQAVGDQDASA